MIKIGFDGLSRGDFDSAVTFDCLSLSECQQWILRIIKSSPG
jgi:hypothetical protein